MTSDRVYRGKLSQDEALAELQRCAGTQFDPSVVAALGSELELAIEEALTPAAVAS
jgi:HD-GYP domain-containing protein (c-di-GMP phosphodiesterase class II)